MHNARVAALTALGLLMALAGWTLGALPLSGAEPEGLFVECGPALFGRPSPLPDPACSGAYAPLAWVSIALLAGAATLAALTLIQWTRAARASSTH